MEPDTQSQKNSDADIKIFAVLGYIFPPLFFIPLLNEKMKDIPLVRFHANQQILLLIGYLLLVVLGNFMLIGFSSLMYSLVQLVNVGLFVLSLYGAYYTYKDEMRMLPLIGHIKFLK